MSLICVLQFDHLNSQFMDSRTKYTDTYGIKASLALRKRKLQQKILLVQVALLDKAHFPRDKYCGDAVCTPAINLLTEMGVLKELQDNNEVHFADNGGFISPSGISYIGRSCIRHGDICLCFYSAAYLARPVFCGTKT